MDARANERADARASASARVAMFPTDGRAIDPVRALCDTFYNTGNTVVCDTFYIYYNTGNTVV